jgi:predicted dehydrogenase
MRWGIVGTGAVAGLFADALGRVPGARLAAVASRSPERGAAFAARTGAGRVVADAPALAALDAVEIVYVTSPHHRHEADALAAIEAGKALLCEKPLAPDAAGAGRIAAAARARGVFAMEGLWSLCLPVYRDAFAAIAAGAIGEVREVTGSFAVPEPYDPAGRFWDAGQGGGALLDRGVYLVALALALLDDPRPVQAESVLAPSGVDASTRFLLADRAGARGVFSVSLASLGANQVVVQGTLGRCVFLEPVPCPPAYGIRRHAPGGPGPAGPAGRLAGIREALKRRALLRRLDRGLMRGTRWFDGGLGDEIAEVERCLAAGLPESPLVPLDRSVRALEILDEIAVLAAR